jgi:hypothetical protein
MQQLQRGGFRMRASGPAKRRGLLLLPDSVVGLDNTLAESRQEYLAKGAKYKILPRNISISALKLSPYVEFKRI